jgi:CitB family two-component system sensor histidine kinase MalK
VAAGKTVLKLRTKITLLVFVVVALALFTANLVISEKVEENTERSQAEKAADIARIIARSSVVINGLTGKGSAAEVQAFTEEIRQVTNVEFIVVMDMNSIRLSHPNIGRIGEPFVGGDEGAVLAGQEYISEAIGTLGPSLRAFCPVYGPDGRQVGAVSVGILLDKVQQAVDQSRAGIYLAILIGLFVGIIGAIILAGNVKKTLFGLEPSAFARLMQERVAMLQSVREGIIAVDKDARITLVNGEGLRLMARAGLTGDPLGQDVETFVPNTRLKDILQTGVAEFDQEQDLGGLILLTNRVPVAVEGEIVGAIATFRDKTEIKQLAEQLTGVRNYAEALRSQAHEFMNKLHVILGMVRLECFDELTAYISDVAQQYQHEVGFVARRIKDPVLAGFLIGKLSRAREAGVELNLDEDSYLPTTDDPAVIHELITISGNLVDNAFDAVEKSPRKKVDISLTCENEVLSLVVSDSGGGVPPEQRQDIFIQGYSTKAADRGMGLFLVRRSLDKLGGQIAVAAGPGGGARFTVKLPYHAKEGTYD